MGDLTGGHGALSEPLSDPVEDLIRDPDLPEALRRILATGVDIEEIRLDAQGRWRYRGGPVAHPKVVALFHRSLKRTAQGHWYLEVGRSSYPVVVEDTGRFVFRILRRDGALHVLLSDGSREPLDPAAIVSDGDTFFGTPVHGGRDLARFVGQAMIDLAELLEEDAGRPGVRTEQGWWVLRDRRIEGGRGS